MGAYCLLNVDCRYLLRIDMSEFKYKFSLSFWLKKSSSSSKQILLFGIVYRVLVEVLTIQQLAEQSQEKPLQVKSLISLS